MITRIVRMALAFIFIASISIVPAWAQEGDSDLELADWMPEGVTFDLLGDGSGQTHRFHTDAMHLHRISLQCATVSGKIFGMEQLTFVEYGQAEVRDWETGELIATLSAGDSFGPTSAEQSFYLVSTPERQASVWHFSSSGSGEIEEELPMSVPEAPTCNSGVAQTPAWSLATTEAVFASDTVGDSGGGSDAIHYVGILTVEPGFALGEPYVVMRDIMRFTSNGAAVVLPLTGGFGDGSTDIAGSRVHSEAPPAQAFALTGEVALQNFGSTPAIALVFGVVPEGEPIMTLNIP